MPKESHGSLMRHLHDQTEPLLAMVDLARLDASRTTELVPEIRDQHDLMIETVGT
jgi:hypothetical protein